MFTEKWLEKIKDMKAQVVRKTYGKQVSPFDLHKPSAIDDLMREIIDSAVSVATSHHGKGEKFIKQTIAGRAPTHAL